MKRSDTLFKWRISGRALRRHDARRPQVFDSCSVSLITPPNVGGVGGSCFPSIVVVALGEPGTPLICCAVADAALISARATDVISNRIDRFAVITAEGQPRHAKLVKLVPRDLYF